jgi:hypothetical protein
MGNFAAHSPTGLGKVVSILDLTLSVDGGLGMGQSGGVPADIEAIRYQGCLERMADLAEGTSAPEEWNRLVKENHASYLVLRESSEGRSAIEALLHHSSPAVRSWAAAQTLPWNEASARPVLEALVAEGGLASVDAKYTLIEYDRGRLSHDW